MKWFRWKIATLLDKNPDYCWASLVTWAIYKEPFWSVFRQKQQICRWNNTGTPYAYCNKCELTGKYYN